MIQPTNGSGLLSFNVETRKHFLCVYAELTLRSSSGRLLSWRTGGVQNNNIMVSNCQYLSVLYLHFCIKEAIFEANAAY